MMGRVYYSSTGREGEPAAATCRRGGCPREAVHPGALCLECGLRYLVWRVRRDNAEAAALEEAGIFCEEELERRPEFARALDLIYEHLFGGPFQA